MTGHAILVLSDGKYTVLAQNKRFRRYAGVVQVTGIRNTVAPAVMIAGLRPVESSEEGEDQPYRFAEQETGLLEARDCDRF